jgi:hypothetical protein
MQNRDGHCETVVAKNVYEELEEKRDINPASVPEIEVFFFQESSRIGH